MQQGMQQGIHDGRCVVSTYGVGPRPSGVGRRALYLLEFHHSKLGESLQEPGPAEPAESEGPKPLPQLVSYCKKIASILHFFAPNRAAQEHAAKQRPNKSRICVLCHAFVRASIAQSLTGTPR